MNDNFLTTKVTIGRNIVHNLYKILLTVSLTKSANNLGVLLSAKEKDWPSIEVTWTDQTILHTNPSKWREGYVVLQEGDADEKV